MPAHVWSFVELTRPVFLLGGALLYGLGAAMAAAHGATIDWGRYALGQAIVTFIQLATHYANEYFDREADRFIGAHRTWFSGGSGVLPTGRLPPGVAVFAARVCVVAASIALGATLFVEPGMSAVGALALLGGWFYSAPPLRLVASGLGETTTALIVAFLAPLGGMIMQRGPIDARLMAVTLPLVLMHLAMLIVFELPDADADRRAGKRTLTIRLGGARAGRLHDALLAAAYAAMWTAAAAGWIDARLAAWASIGLPLAVWQSLGARRRSPHNLHRLTAGGVGLFAVTATAFLAGFIIKSIR